MVVDSISTYISTMFKNVRIKLRVRRGSTTNQQQQRFRDDRQGHNHMTVMIDEIEIHVIFKLSSYMCN